jgi:hypothetical protein
VFICNQAILWDGPKSESRDYSQSSLALGHIHKFFPPSVPEKVDGMQLSTDYLRTYSRRTISYENNIVDAISGITNTLKTYHAGNPIYHICGTPFVLAGGDSLSVWIALDWFHIQPCRRRSNLPSWSSLAWDGPIKWVDPMALRPHDSRGYKCTIRTGDQPIDIEQLRTESHPAMALDASQGNPLLEITAKFVELPLFTQGAERGLQYSTGSEPQLVFAVDNIELVVQRYWDKLPHKDDTTAPLRGLFFNNYEGHRDDETLACSVLLLEAHGGYYERVGLVYTFLDPSRTFRRISRDT